jgi:hypothetical protein
MIHPPADYVTGATSTAHRPQLALQTHNSKYTEIRGGGIISGTVPAFSGEGEEIKHFSQNSSSQYRGLNAGHTKNSAKMVKCEDVPVLI